MRSPSVRRLLWALALSVALHAALVFGPQLQPPGAPRPAAMTLQARLAARPPAAHPAARIRAPAKKSARRKTPPPPAAAEALVPEPPSATAVVTPEPAPEAPGPAEPAAPPEEADRAEAPPPPAAEEASPPAAEGPRPFPAQAEILYTLFKGSNGLSVGKVVQTWQSSGGRYSLTSVAEATGIFSLIVPGRLVQISQGELAANGLKPESFWIQRGQSEGKTESAQFDWLNKNLTFGGSQGKRSVVLPEQAQDVLSFAYHLALTAPHSGTVRLFITTGRKLESYDYEVIGEESLETPLGPLVTQHLGKRRGTSEEGAEIWLAVDYHYLPVKVRLIDKKGDVAEQVASEIRVSP